MIKVQEKYEKSKIFYYKWMHVNSSYIYLLIKYPHGAIGDIQKYLMRLIRRCRWQQEDLSSNCIA